MARFCQAVLITIRSQSERSGTPVRAIAPSRSKNISAFRRDLVPAGDETFLFEICFATKALNISFAGRLLPAPIICRGCAMRRGYGDVSHTDRQDKGHARHCHGHWGSPPTTGPRTPNIASFRHRSPSLWRGPTNEGTPGGCAILTSRQHCGVPFTLQCDRTPGNTEKIAS